MADPKPPAVVLPGCAECGKTLTGRAKLFCSRDHKIAFRNRAKIRGQTVLPFLLAAAQARHNPSDVGRYATRQMWALARKWNAEDRAAGRPNAAGYAAVKMAELWQACDLD